MARRTVVQRERLRDQVYRLIRDDMKKGVLQPGQRIVEGELADRYKVSRTPVREALFQLARDGLISAGAERGYVISVDSPQSTAFRHEVRGLIDPRLAYYAAADSTPEERKALQKTHEAQKQAHEAGRLQAFVTANNEFRLLLRSMCRNRLLAQCSALVDDLAQWARRNAFTQPENRDAELEHCGRVAAAIQAGDPAGAEAAMQDYVRMVRQRSDLPIAEHPMPLGG
jgi:DNA-binding GntR family transcriptional regulator